MTRLERGIEETDALGDAVVAALATPKSGGMRAVNAWLAGDPGVPEALAALLDPLADVPPWVNWDRVDRAGDILWRNGILWIGLTFHCAALAAGYQSGAGVKPLVFTGELDYRAKRRMQETGRWFLAATSPGGLRRDGTGFAECLRVRVMHASVRRRILRSGSWNTGKWGAPINLTDTAYGISGEFSTIPVEAMRDAGLRFTATELDDLEHLWRYIGHLLGVPDDLLPHSYAEATEIIRVKHRTDTPADDDSRRLVRALIESGVSPDTVLPPWLAERGPEPLWAVLYALTRRWAGAAVADSLDLPDTPLKHLPTLTRPVVLLGEAVRRFGLRDDHAMAQRTRRRFLEILDRENAPVSVAADRVVGEAV